MKLCLFLFLGLTGCTLMLTPSNPTWYGHRRLIDPTPDYELSYICSRNAMLASDRVASITSATTVAELATWIYADKRAWQEMASHLDR
jgi:hypothetical protein